jgi:prepilin-type N-terminal cleavage/methylation domain-containing protein
VRSAERVRARTRGFTLVELLVGLVIGAILITVILRMVTGQTRFALVQGAREEVQQNARGALEIVGSELRTAVTAGLVRAQEREVVLMLPRLWGVACGTVGTEVVAVFPDAPGLTIPGGAGAGLLVQTPDLEWHGWTTNLNSNERASISAVAPFVLGNPPAAPCTQTAPAGQVAAFRFSGPNNAILNVVPGAIVVVYELVRYDVAENAAGEWWLRRSNGWTTGGNFSMQPLAGPVDRDAVRFRYFSGNPSAEIGAPGINQALLSSVRMVQFTVRTLSRSKLDGTLQQQEEGEVIIQLRNW